jgi:hypothetical protein
MCLINLHLIALDAKSEFWSAKAPMLIEDS